MDPNILSFERFKWGGVRRDKVEYLTFDLEQLARAARLRPTLADIDLGQQLIDHLRRLPAGTTAALAMPQLKMIKVNSAERQMVLDILGVCGLLQTAEYPGYADRFISKKERKVPRQRHVFARSAGGQAQPESVLPRCGGFCHSPPEKPSVPAGPRFDTFMKTLVPTASMFSTRARTARLPCNASAIPSEAKIRALASGIAASKPAITVCCLAAKIRYCAVKLTAAVAPARTARPPVTA